jgi:hypothetical protein
MKCVECAAGHYGIPRGVPIALANKIWGKLERATVDMFLPVSRAIAEVTQLSRHRVPYRIIPNFIADNLELSSLEEFPSLAQLPKQDYLLFVGMLGHGKGVEVLIQAHTESGTHAPPLVLIGRPQPDFRATIRPDFRATIRPNVYALESWLLGIVTRCATQQSRYCMILFVEHAWGNLRVEELFSFALIEWWPSLSKSILRLLADNRKEQVRA